MLPYPTEPLPVADAVSDYATPPEDAAEAFGAAQLSPSPFARILGAFNALRPHVADIDTDGLVVLAGCAELVMRYQWGGMTAEAMTVRDAARARLALIEE